MAQNKGANVRYRAIDKCLSAKHGRYGWRLHRGRWAHLPELKQGQRKLLYDSLFVTILFKMCDKIWIFFIFFFKNLVNSKKCSIFASIFSKYVAFLRKILLINTNGKY